MNAVESARLDLVAQRMNCDRSTAVRWLVNLTLSCGNPFTPTGDATTDEMVAMLAKYPLA